MLIIKGINPYYFVHPLKDQIGSVEMLYFCLMSGFEWGNLTYGLYCFDVQFLQYHCDLGSATTAELMLGR